MSRGVHQVIVHTESNGAGLAGFVISLVGFLTCGLLSPIGLLLSMIGLVSQPRGLAVAGTILGALGSWWLFAGGFAIVLAFIGLFGAAAVAPELIESTPPPTLADRSSSPADDDVPEPPPAASTAAVEVPRSIRQQDVAVRVTSAGVQRVALEGFRTSRSQDDLLQIDLEITNHHPSRLIRYTGWSAQALEADFGGRRAKLRDDAGNTYSRVHFGFGTRVFGQVEDRTSIYPATSLTDVLIFEPPVAAATDLFLELPAEAFGGQGLLTFRIPRSFWEPAVEPESPTTPTEPTTAAPTSPPPPAVEESPLKQLRTWTDASGAHAIEARFVSLANGIVKLQRDDGTTVDLPLDKLSPADQDFIRRRGR